MLKVPKKVHDAFNELKDQYDHIYLKQLRGRFYVYRHTYEWQADTQRSKTIAEYLGKIMPDGVFVKRIVSYKDEFEKAKALIAAHGGRIIWEEKKELKELVPQTPQNVKIKDTDLKLLMALSMNARMPVSKLAKLVGLNKQTTYYRIKSLEKQFNLKYLLEIDIEKLGYTQYIILIKFEEDIPTIEELENAFKYEPKIQFAAITKGEYDVVIHIVAEDSFIAYNDLVALRSKSSLYNYKAYWYLIHFAQTYSFMPLKDSFFDNVLKDKVWHRTITTPNIGRGQLKYREFILLKEMNNRSIINFGNIDAKYNFTKGTSRYTYLALKSSGKIVRPTITIANQAVKYIGIILVSNVHQKKIIKNHYKFWEDIIGYGTILNKYSFIGNIGTPNGAILFLPVMQEGTLEYIAEAIRKELQGSIVKTLIVTNIITGSLCYRRFDNTHSKQYARLVELGKVEFKGLINYE